MHSFAALFATYRDAWLVALLVALGCSLVAVYVVLRRVAFLGLAVSQVAAAGVAVAFLLHAPPLLLGALFTAVGVIVFSVGREPVRVSREALVGVAFAVASALSVLVVFRSSRELDHIEHIVYGSLLYVTPEHVAWLAAGVGVVVLLHILFRTQFALVAIDPDTASTLGVRPRRFEGLLGATAGVMIALSIQTAGSLLTFAMLVLPALTALLLAERLPSVLLLSPSCGVGSVVAGLSVAILFDLPPGPTIVLAAAILLGCAALTRIHRILGVLALVAAIGLTVLLAAQLPDHDRSRPPTDSASFPGATLRVELDVALPIRSIAAGEPLRVEFHGHVHGTPPRELWVLVELGDQMAAARLPVDEGIASLELASTGLPAGEHRIVASVWTGPPLDPDDATRPLDRDECSVNESTVVVRP